VDPLIDDKIRFVRAYAGIMEMSTPHIYLSTIAFIPSDSPLHLYEVYSGAYPRGLKLVSDGHRCCRRFKLQAQSTRLHSLATASSSSLTRMMSLFRSGMRTQANASLVHFKVIISRSNEWGFHLMAKTLSLARMTRPFGSGMCTQTNQLAIRSKVILTASCR
jgi:hypothetical protein